MKPLLGQPPKTLENRPRSGKSGELRLIPVNRAGKVMEQKIFVANHCLLLRPASFEGNSLFDLPLRPLGFVLRPSDYRVIDQSAVKRRHRQAHWRSRRRPDPAPHPCPTVHRVALTAPDEEVAGLLQYNARKQSH